MYYVDRWAAGFFDVNKRGRVVARPKRLKGPAIDLKKLVEDLQARGYELPLLIRFSDILAERIEEIAGCFLRAIEDYEYEGSYRGVYPIKVNQQAHVVAELLEFGRERHLGLEVGSKPELLVALAMLDDPEALVVCNGYKDAAYVETALLAQKLGRQTILVIDRFRELEMVLATAKRLGLRPRLGVRVKLLTRGAGRWSGSGGSRSKFGLTISEIQSAVELLAGADMLDSLELLHFHIGSQVPSIHVFKDALREASRVFVELKKAGAAMSFFDVGGGLAVDYDGSRTDFHSSMNYSIQEYANDVVALIQEACRKAEVEEPIIVSESGRALVSHHAMLVFDVLDTNRVEGTGAPDQPDEDAHEIVRELFDIHGSVTPDNLLEPYHDAVELREQSQQLFNLGYLDLAARAHCEQLFFACCQRIQEQLVEREHVPEDLENLKKQLADTYFCNFSLFQSLPDAWAVGQLFPIMPIHRLTERPTRQATLADLTCDSDGKIDRFIDLEDVSEVLDLHPVNGRPYYLAAFLVGAYQEILGDLHNLFGDTNAIHIRLSGDRYRVVHVERGDTVTEVLDYVAFDKRDLQRRIQEACEEAVWQQRITPRETSMLLKRFDDGLNAYTYLERGPDPT